MRGDLYKGTLLHILNYGHAYLMDVWGTFAGVLLYKRNRTELLYKTPLLPRGGGCRKQQGARTKTYQP